MFIKKYILSLILILLLVSCFEDKKDNVKENDLKQKEEQNIIYFPVIEEDQGVSTDVIMGGDFSYLNNEIKTMDISKFSKGELRILRNSIFAKYGYIFVSDDLREHFSQFSWYNGSHTNVQTELTSTDWKNVASIQLLEISDDFYSKPDFYFPRADPENYDRGFLYVEFKNYHENDILFHKYQENLKVLPVLYKGENQNGLYYSLTGHYYPYNGETGINEFTIMTVRIKYTEDNFSGSNYEILSGLGILDDDVLPLTNDIGKEGFFTSEGIDEDGEYTFERKLFYDVSDEIEDLFKLYYAVTVFLKINHLNEFNNISKEALAAQMFDDYIRVK